MTAKKYRVIRDYESGEIHGNAKLTYEDTCLIKDMVKYRDDRIKAIDEEIEKLKQERRKLKNDINQKQLAFKFDVSVDCVSSILRGRTWNNEIHPQQKPN